MKDRIRISNFSYLHTLIILFSSKNLPLRSSTYNLNKSRGVEPGWPRRLRNLRSPDKIWCKSTQCEVESNFPKYCKFLFMLAVIIILEISCRQLLIINALPWSCNSERKSTKFSRAFRSILLLSLLSFSLSTSSSRSSSRMWSSNTIRASSLSIESKSQSTENEGLSRSICWAWKYSWWMSWEEDYQVLSWYIFTWAQVVLYLMFVIRSSISVKRLVFRLRSAFDWKG